MPRWPVVSCSRQFFPLLALRRRHYAEIFRAMTRPRDAAAIWHSTMSGRQKSPRDGDGQIKARLPSEDEAAPAMTGTSRSSFITMLPPGESPIMRVLLLILRRLRTQGAYDEMSGHASVRRSGRHHKESSRLR